jgi:hypothetical protein
MLAVTAWLGRRVLKVQIAYKHKQTIMGEDSRIDWCYDGWWAAGTTGAIVSFASGEETSWESVCEDDHSAQAWSCTHQ